MYTKVCIQPLLRMLYTNKGGLLQLHLKVRKSGWSDNALICSLRRFLQIQKLSFCLQRDFSSNWTELKSETTFQLAPFKIISLWGPMHVWTHVEKIPKIISCGENEVEDLQLVIVQLVHSTDHLIYRQISWYTDWSSWWPELSADIRSDQLMIRMVSWCF